MRVEHRLRFTPGIPWFLFFSMAAIFLGGCADQKTVVITNPSPATPPAPAQAKPSVPASLPPTVPHPQLPAQTPAPSVPPSPEPPAVGPELVPAPIPQEPPVLVVPQTAPKGDLRGVEACEARILKTERILLLLDRTRFNAAQQDLFLTIQSFLAKAKLALSHEDLLRANTLADKAQTLADELFNNTKK